VFVKKIVKRISQINTPITSQVISKIITNVREYCTQKLYN